MNLHYNFTVILLHYFFLRIRTQYSFFCLHLPYNQQCLVGKTLNKTRIKIRANVFIDPKTYVGPFDILNLEYQALN